MIEFLVPAMLLLFCMPVALMFTPGCTGAGCGCGEVTCEICDDDFNRADSSNINIGAPFTWDIRDGAASISGNLLEISTSDTLLICGTGHPDNLASAVVTADVYFGANDPARIIVGHDGSDDDNFHFVEIKPYELALYEMVSGTPNLLACVGCDATGNPSTIRVYFDGETTGRFTATCGTAVVETDGISAAGKKYVGLGLGTVDGGIAFDNFTFAKHKQEGNSCSEYGPDDCDLGSDQFNRSDDADPGCGWDEQAGTSSIASGGLSFTAANSRARFNISNPDNGALSVNVDYTSTNDNNVAEIGVGANSAGTTRFYCRITSGTSKTFLIGSTASGTLDSKTITTTSGSTYAVTVTLDDTRLCASIYSGATLIGFLSATVTTPAVESWATLGTVGLSAGSVKFDNFELTRGKHADSEGCPACFITAEDCTDCTADCGVGGQFIVDVAGGLTDEAGCDNCVLLDGSFALDFLQAPCVYAYCLCYEDDEGACDEDGGTCFAALADVGCMPFGGGDVACLYCGGVAVFLEVLVDEEGLCYLRVTLGVVYTRCPGFGETGWMAFAQYESEPGLFMSPCSGDTFTLTRYDGADVCSFTTPNSYRNETGWAPPDTAGCDGSFPATITVRWQA